MSRELVVIKRSIDDEDRFIVEGIEVEDGDYKDASKFEIIFYRDQGYTSWSPRAWYDEVEELARDEQELKFFKQW